MEPVARKAIAAAMVLAICGCVPAPTKPVAQPEPPPATVIRIPGATKYVAIPDRFTAPTPEPKAHAGGIDCTEMDRLLFAYAAALRRANADKAEIRKRSGQAVKP